MCPQAFWETECYANGTESKAKQNKRRRKQAINPTKGREKDIKLTLFFHAASSEWFFFMLSDVIWALAEAMFLANHYTLCSVPLFFHLWLTVPPRNNNEKFMKSIPKWFRKDFHGIRKRQLNFLGHKCVLRKRIKCIILWVILAEI